MSQCNNNDNDRSPPFKEIAGIPYPPPPLYLFAEGQFKVCSIVDSPKKCQKVEDDLKDLFRIIISALVTDEKAFVFNYKYLTPVLQDGPNCGLAALSMVSSCQTNSMKVEDIFNHTKSKGFSNNGEMFSVHYMADIAKTLIGCDVEVLESGIQNREAVINEIISGGLLLIPYDADFNHSPCKKKGHRAHWAVVVGLILEGTLPVDSQDVSEETKANCIQYLPDQGNFAVKHISKAHACDKVYMVARQGKSLHPAVWKYDDLKDSNENLVEFDPSRANSELDYILPPEGVEGGLKGKALFLRGLPTTTCDELKNYLRILKNLF
ncbi:UPF0692 protein C19orf54 homolog [Ischnura elegans]|uniref:UPF0692 protein C19orf54 homolog n=1 Tax=Ischnura elegans TaxID=197161 RepID=UPI001ED870BC|nr:UPF0692 protein C19orf54 homolog [Ischnura elegans]